MTEFLYRPKKTKTRRPVKFKTSDGDTVEFKAKRRPQRRARAKFKTNAEKHWWEKL